MGLDLVSLARLQDDFILLYDLGIRAYKRRKRNTILLGLDEVWRAF